MLVSQVIRDKGGQVYAIGSDKSLAEAAKLLLERRIGAAVVMNDSGAVLGLLSERDIVRAAAEAGPDGLGQPVAAWMSRQVVLAALDETIETLLGRMTDRRTRHLPVIADGRLVGIVSIGDLVKHKIAAAEAEAEELKAYIAA